MRLGTGVAAGLLGSVLLAGWWLTRPIVLSGDAPLGHQPDVTAGEQLFWTGGCASCHASPVGGKRARGDARLKLGGGLELDTPYGIFRVPNISPHADGIGGWSGSDFVNAMKSGVTPDGRHYYPSFPYASYAKMTTADVLDLKAFLDTLEAIPGRVAGHELRFPWSFRRGIGLWKRRYLSEAPIIEFDADDAELERGRYLVESAGHCGECHSPRDRFGGLDTRRWLGGAPNPDGRGRVPNITPAGKNTAGWSAGDLEYYFESGFTPDFDTVGGSMVAVQENLAELPASDRKAIAAYLKAIPPVE